MTSRFFFLFLVGAITLQLAACTKNNTTPSSGLPVSAATVAGNFTVTSFVSSGETTSLFDGYFFTFNENGTLIAKQGNDTVSGTWRFDDSDSTELKISFPSAPLNEMNKGWHIAELTEDHLWLTDDDDNSDDSSDDNPKSRNKIEFERH